ncbi:hypothetical protein K443DRAFT_135537 [Laccaria amethystina LaAM-08-1]|uniref:Uncharacterized protein n=1 Tax=Laccaria amethystina LaAM-08-1 TaxID=1095629 RepID=A0A0C9WSU4_9AGAR|nr:hypothetical protein K443DRAFT_135537 [Laccaria amethystina LaAM-08-1]
MFGTFPFTFKLSVPGLSNPFSVPPVTPPELPPVQDRTGLHDDAQKRPRRQRPSPSPTPSLSPPPQQPLSRKRGWEPTFAEPSRSTATLASPAGYLDTPAKYRELMSPSTPNDHEYHDITMSDTPELDLCPLHTTLFAFFVFLIVALTPSLIHFMMLLDRLILIFHVELPPVKRRRGLAGSIVSTALSAALIGTAVGLTVYRLWRDRGKEAPPPPYQQEWTPVEQAPVVQVTPSTPTPNPTPSRPRKSRQQVSSLKRPVAHHRRPRVRPHTYITPPHTASSSSALFPPTQPEFSFALEQEQGPVEDQMDWIGDKLAMLIEEGKRALQSEVVVMSDAQEDEVDDGTGLWEEEEPRPSLSRASSITRAGSKRLAAPSLPIPSASPRRGGFEIPLSVSSSSDTPRRSHSRGISYESALPSSLKEEPGAWASPELRVSMEKARARILAKRGS